MLGWDPGGCDYLNLRIIDTSRAADLHGVLRVINLEFCHLRDQNAQEKLRGGHCMDFNAQNAVRSRNIIVHFWWRHLIDKGDTKSLMARDTLLAWNVVVSILSADALSPHGTRASADTGGPISGHLKGWARELTFCTAHLNNEWPLTGGLGPGQWFNEISSSTHMWDWSSLKRKCRHFDQIFFIGRTKSCYFDNFQCDQRWNIHQNEGISISVLDRACHFEMCYQRDMFIVNAICEFRAIC